jgi:hypothetical protein
MTSDELTVTLNVFVALEEAASVAFTVKVEVPELVGVPETMPMLEDRTSPDGSAPEATVQV